MARVKRTTGTDTVQCAMYRIVGVECKHVKKSVLAADEQLEAGRRVKGYVVTRAGPAISSSRSFLKSIWGAEHVFYVHFKRLAMVASFSSGPFH